MSYPPFIQGILDWFEKLYTIIFEFLSDIGVEA